MRILFYIGIGALLFSCKKPTDRACAKSYGEEKMEERTLGNFESIFLGPHIKYTLTQDTVNKVIIRSGENMINFVKTEIVDGELSVTNENKCNFLRSYKKGVEVELHLIDVSKIEFEGTKELTCSNQMNLSNLTFVVRDGAGHVDLNVVSPEMQFIVTHGWGNFTLHGAVNYLRLEIRSNGFGETYDMNVLDSLHLISSTQETVMVNSDNALMRVEINQDGDVWYVGQPSFIEFTQFGTGELIDKN